MIPQLLRQGRAPQVDGIPAGVQPPVQALQDQPRPAGGGQPLPPVVSPGVDLDLNAAPVHAVGPRPRHGHALIQRNNAHTPPAAVGGAVEGGAEVPGPLLREQDGDHRLVDEPQRVSLRQGGGKPLQPRPVEYSRLLFDGIPELLHGPLSEKRLDHRLPVRSPGDQDGTRGLLQQRLVGLPGQEGEILADDHTGAAAPADRPPSHDALEAGPDHRLLPALEQGGQPLPVHHCASLKNASLPYSRFTASSRALAVIRSGKPSFFSKAARFAPLSGPPVRPSW